MPRKKPQQNTTGEVGGYLRVSDVQFPAGCASPDQRRAYVEDLKRVRMAELVSDAAVDGETITRWYDDMGISGRGEFLEKRVEFDRARADATAGALRRLYSRDLSRLFRDLIGQELWFQEMEACGTTVHIKDLPFIADEATRVLIRQNIGALNQYMATKTGALLRTVLHEKVRSGKWVGRMLSTWGLRYDHASKGFLLDASTQDKACVLFETFVACGGVGCATARTMNRMWDARQPRATLSIRGARWASTTVLQVVRRSVYRRVITYGETTVHAPALIPEVVPPDLVAEADRMLETRAPGNTALGNRIKAGRMDYTYGAGLLRCAYCGYPMRALSYPKKRPEDTAQEWRRVISWCCNESRRSKALCAESGSVGQSRLDILVGQGIGQALELYRAAFGTPAPSSRRPKRPAALRTTKDSLEARRGELAAQRQRCLEMFRAGLVKSMAELQEMVRPIEEEDGRLRAQMEGVTEEAGPDAPPALPALSEAQWGRLQSGYAQVFAGGAPPFQQGSFDVALDQPKHDLLRSLGAGIHVKVIPRETTQRKENNSRTYGGILIVILELHTLGLTGPRAITLTESDAQYADYRRWWGGRLSAGNLKRQG